MKRFGLALVVLLFLGLPAHADVTLTMSMTVSAGPTAMNGQLVASIKGARFRSDVKGMNQDASVLIDPATKQQVVLNHLTRQVQTVNPGQAMAGMPMTFGDAKVSVTPLGQTRQILGRTCHGFNVEIATPMTMGGETLTMRMTGPVWLAKDGPGIEEYKAAQKALADSGLSMSPLAQGPQAKGMAEVAKALADAGMMMEQEVRMTVEGTGQLAQMMGQMGNATMLMKVTAISTDPIPDARFAIPEGYTRR